MMGNNVFDMSVDNLTVVVRYGAVWTDNILVVAAYSNPVAANQNQNIRNASGGRTTTPKKQNFPSSPESPHLQSLYNCDNRPFPSFLLQTPSFAPPVILYTSIIMTIPLNGSARVHSDIEAPPRPKDVGILAMEMYFPRRVRVEHYAAREGLSLRLMTNSASPRRSSRSSTVSQRANTPSVLARNSWPAVMTAKTSTRSP